MSAAPRIVIAAGGTAGHVVPALAVAAELRERGAQVSFIGGSRAEAELVPAAGFAFHALAVEGLSRSDPVAAVRALGRAAAASLAAGRLLRRLHPHAVMGGGGYASGPVGLAALAMRVPLVLTEADSHLGISNRILARGAAGVCLAFPIADRRGVPLAEREPHRYLLTGRPIFPVFADMRAARARFGVTDGRRCILVFGGSLGARTVNLAAVEGLPAVAEEGVRVLHVCGRRDHPELAERDLPAGYELIEYLDVDEFNQALSAADLVIGRAGGSVFEIAAHGLPAILVPYPHASADHQAENARWMSAAGAAVVIADEQLSARRLAAEARALLADGQRLSAMAAASRAIARPRAAAEVAERILQAASR